MPNSKFKILNSLWVALAVIVFPLAVDAQALLLKAPQTSYEVGQNFSVSLSINTEGASINTVSGFVDIPQDKVEIVDVRYGSSIVSLWVERPTVDYGKGIIKFAGGIPGGFSGSNGAILSFGLKARREGKATLTLNDIKVLLNDGQGTEASNIKAGTLSF